jgi:YidC/Oxa1 family membrane protein insertase
MDRNSSVALILIAVIVGVYLYFTMPSQTEIQAQKRVADSIALISKNGIQHTATVKNNSTDSIAGKTATIDSTLQNSVGSLSNLLVGTNTQQVLENKIIKIVLDTKGGGISSLQLKKYKKGDKTDLMLISNNSHQLGFEFYSTQNVLLNTNQFYYTVSTKTNNSITLKASIDSNAYFSQTYSLQDSSYMIDYTTEWHGMKQCMASNSNMIGVKWDYVQKLLEYSSKLEGQNSSLHYLFENDDDDKLDETSTTEEKQLPTNVKWISAKQQFFNFTIIAPKSFSDVKLKLEDPKDSFIVKKYNTYASLPFNVSTDNVIQFKIYAGPNQYNTLKSYGLGLEKIINLGAGIFKWVKWINRALLYPLFNFINGWNLNYGLIILIMVLIIRGLLIPLNYKTFVSSARMKVLKPELDELRTKFKDDQAKFGQEQLKLHRKAGVSMLGGCLPQLALIPIFVTMYYFFPSNFDFRQQSFLWAKDLSSFDSILSLPFEIPFYGSHISLFTLLMTITSYITIFMNKNQMQMNSNDPNMKMMQWMQYVFPVMFLGVFNNSPAALSFYYFLQNVISIVIQKGVQLFFIDEKKLRIEIEENMKKPLKKSGWQSRLEEAYKMKEQQAKLQSKKK